MRDWIVLHEDRSRAESFGSQAARYDRARPRYPAAVIADVLGPRPAGRRVLDVGCGTGIAARLLGAAGALVLGVEVDARMAEVARSHGVEVEVATFESWESRGRLFERVVAAQAWHWIDPLVGPEKAAAVLEPGGSLQCVWNVGAFSVDLAATIDPIYQELAPDIHESSVIHGASVGREGEGALRYEVERQGIARCDLFEEPTFATYGWRQPYRTAEWIELLRTHSDHALLEEPVREELLARVATAIEQRGGVFELEYQTLRLSALRR